MREPTSLAIRLAAGPLVSAPLPLATSLKGILFDIDGTLTDSDPLHFTTFVEILQEKGFNGGQPITEQFFRDRISGRHNPDIAADLFPNWSKEQRALFSEEKEQRFRALAGSTTPGATVPVVQAGRLKPTPGLTELLDWVKSNRLAVVAVTNAPRANAMVMLDALGLSDFFDTLIFGEECTRAKPHPDPYLDALKFVGLQPHEAIIFEDSPSGLQAGVAAGVPVVAIASGHDPHKLIKLGASVVVNDFKEFMKLMELKN